MQDYFSDPGHHWNLRLYETNFIPTFASSRSTRIPERGIRTSIMRLSMASTALGMHVMSVSEGTYATAYRHQAGAHVIVVEGSGYELMFMEHERENPRKVDASAYAVVAPKLNEYHQHFNTGKGDYKMLAFRGHSLRYGIGQIYRPGVDIAKHGQERLELHDPPHTKEDPSIRENYWPTWSATASTCGWSPSTRGAARQRGMLVATWTDGASRDGAR